MLGWETSAPTRCTLERTEGGHPQLRVTLPTAMRLEPGMTLEVPKAFLGAYSGDLDDGCYLAHRFVEEHLAWPNPGNDFPYLMFNSWGYGTAIYDSLAREAINLCAQLGVELFVTDFGWEGPDWAPLPEAFPDGLSPLADLCHGKGLMFGFHFSLGNVTEMAAMYRDHPDWVHVEG
jgi:alpha-galactosidase